MKSKGGTVCYSEQLQTTLFCPVPACISVGTDNMVRYKDEESAKNGADPEYVPDVLLLDWLNELGLGRGAIGVSLGGEANKVA